MCPIKDLTGITQINIENKVSTQRTQSYTEKKK